MIAIQSRIQRYYGVKAPKRQPQRQSLTSRVQKEYDRRLQPSAACVKGILSHKDQRFAPTRASDQHKFKRRMNDNKPSRNQQTDERHLASDSEFASILVYETAEMFEDRYV